MRRAMLSVLAGAAVLASCVSVYTDDQATPDQLLAAIAQATPRECPVDRRQAGARTSGETERVGVSEREIARVPLSDGRGVLRLRRLDIAPGGVLPWHDHVARQGVTVTLLGEMTEYRNDCPDPIRFHAGDVVRETAETAHYWRNETSAPAAVLVSDVLAN